MIRVLAVVGVLVLALLLIGAQSAEPRADLTIYNGNDVATLDPQRLSWIPDMRVAQIVFETLVQHDVLDHDFTIIPSAAESWSVSDDGLTYRFRIRESARWSNGAPLLAEHYVYAWRRGMLPDIASDYSAMFRLIDGADDLFAWRAEQLSRMERGESPYPGGEELWRATLERFGRTVGLLAEDDRTLVVRLREPTPYFLDLCALAVFAPVYPPLVDRYERPDPATGRLIRRPGWTKPPEIVSNGAFVVASWRFRRGLRLEQNPHWWDRENLHVRSIEIPSVADPNSAVLAYRTGAFDVMTELFAGYRGEIVRAKQAFRAEHAGEVARLQAQGLDPFEIDRHLPADPRAHAHIVPAFGTYFWNFNCSTTLADGRPNPFADARVRRAFAMVVDKRAIADEVRRMGEPVARSLIPAGSISGYTPPAGLRCVSDGRTPAEREAIVAEARGLLADAGYPTPAVDFPITVELLFNKDSGHDLVAQVIARNWQQHLGVAVSLEQKELKVFRDDVKSHRFITSRASWFGDYGDPTSFLDIMQTGDGNNDRAFSDERFDGLLAAARSERDPAARLSILAEAERVLVEEELPMFPVLHYVQVSMFDPRRVTGLSSHPRTKQVLSLLDVLGDGVGADAPRPMRGRP